MQIERAFYDQIADQTTSGTDAGVYYVTIGSVRGECGHRHKTLAAAQRCLERDMEGCAMQGGYSDRRVVAVERGLLRGLTDAEQAILDREDTP
jgi:hypothetical protein